MMKLYGWLSLAALCALPQVTRAAPAVPPKALGSVEATVKFCAQADSKSADKYKEWGKLLVREMSEKELAEARSSSDYKETYETITAELEKIPSDKAVETCRAALTQSDK